MSQRLYDRYGRLHDPDARMIRVPNLQRAYLRAASPHLLNALGSTTIPGCTDANVQGDDPGFRQPFPATAVDLITALGATGVIAPAAVAAIYLCDTATPLVDSLGLGPNLVAAGAPLTGRECVGLPDTSFTSKAGVELIENTFNQRFADAGAVFGDVAEGAVLSVLLVARYNPNSVGNGRVIGKEGGVGAGIWTFGGTPSPAINLYATNGYIAAGVVGSWTDGAWFNAACVLDSRVLGAHVHQLYTDRGDSGWSVPYATVLTAANPFTIGAPTVAAATSGFQLAYLAFVNAEITSAMRTTFWRARGSAGLGTPNAYGRNSQLVCPVTASRVGVFGGGNTPQVAIGYNAGFLTDGNALQTGMVSEDAHTFEPIGSDNLPTNTLDAGGNTHTTVDGADGMRSGIRTVQGAAWWLGPPGSVCCYIVPAALIGATNVPWLYGSHYRRATVGTTARAGITFIGDPGGREDLLMVSDAATPVDWVLVQPTVTPIGAAHTNMYPCFGAALINQDCDWSEMFIVRNRATPVLAWRRVGLVAAAATANTYLPVTNTGNRRHSPARGTLELKFAGFQGTNGAQFYNADFSIGAFGNPGAMCLDYNAGQLRLQVWDATAWPGVLAATVLCGPLGTGGYHLRISWDHAYPIPGTGGAYIIVEQINVGASPTVLGTWLGPGWTVPTSNVSPLGIGCDVLAGATARCLISLA